MNDEVEQEFDTEILMIPNNEFAISHLNEKLRQFTAVGWKIISVQFVPRGLHEKYQSVRYQYFFVTKCRPVIGE